MAFFDSAFFKKPFFKNEFYGEPFFKNTFFDDTTIAHDKKTRTLDPSKFPKKPKKRKKPAKEKALK